MESDSESEQEQEQAIPLVLESLRALLVEHNLLLSQTEQYIAELEQQLEHHMEVEQPIDTAFMAELEQLHRTALSSIAETGRSNFIEQIRDYLLRED